MRVFIRVKKFFSQDQILCSRHEVLLSDPEQELNRIAKFLDISEFKISSSLIVHKGEYKSVMLKRDREYLTSVYREDIDRLEAEFGWDLRDWKR